MYDYRARFYDPALGRFTQPDPIVPEPGNPQDLNRYSYTRNNPLKYTDPTGHEVRITLPELPLPRWARTGVMRLALNLACGILPCHVDTEQGVIRTTPGEFASSAVLLNPMSVAGPGANAAKGFVEEGSEQLARRVGVIQALGEAIEPHLGRWRAIAGEDALIGFRGSLAEGHVLNPKKPTRGQLVNLKDFDVDAFIISDELRARYPKTIWGDRIPELEKFQSEFTQALERLPEFEGLRRGGFGFRIWSTEEAAREFGGEELYFILTRE